MSIFKRLRTSRALSRVGSQVDVNFIVFVNNDEPRTFDSKKSALAFISDYRQENVIFNLKLYRVEIYSL